MGLDVTGYRRITMIEVIFDEEGDPIDPITGRVPDVPNSVFWANVNPHFATRAGTVIDDAFYQYEECHSFNVGGYGTYGRWREELARLAGYLYVPPTSEKERGSHMR